MIQDGSHVRLHYSLFVDDRLLAMTYGGKPFEYTHGTGDVVLGIEENLAGLEPGDRKSFDVPPETGYGSRDPSAVTTLPRSALPQSGELCEGDTVTGTIGGEVVEAIVAHVAGNDVTLDFNHPLAGKTIHLEVEVLEIVDSPAP
jgi:FKBP-type peptidyl-prolyl cis-trans isomerase 2